MGHIQDERRPLTASVCRSYVCRVLAPSLPQVFNVLFVIGACAFASKEMLTLTAWPLARDCSYYSVTLLALAMVYSFGPKSKNVWPYPLSLEWSMLWPLASCWLGAASSPAASSPCCLGLSLLYALAPRTGLLATRDARCPWALLPIASWCL